MVKNEINNIRKKTPCNILKTVENYMYKQSLSGKLRFLYLYLEPVSALKRFQSFREITFFLREVGVGPHRGGSSVKMSTKRGRSYLCKLPWGGPGTHVFSRFFLCGWTSYPKTLDEVCQRGLEK